MFDQEINEQLKLLQDELLKLKKTTDYINNARENADNIISVLEKVQQNYVQYTDTIFNLYKKYISELHDSVEFLEKYKKMVETLQSLINSLESVDFPARLSSIDKNIDTVTINLSNQIDKGIDALNRNLVDKIDKGIDALNRNLVDKIDAFNNDLSNKHEILSKRLDKQDKNITFVKYMSIFVFVVVVLGFVATNFIFR